VNVVEYYSFMYENGKMRHAESPGMRKEDKGE
jgi:hypothetical protein